MTNPPLSTNDEEKPKRRRRRGPLMMMFYDETLKRHYGEYKHEARELAERFDVSLEDIYRRASHLNLTCNHNAELNGRDYQLIYALHREGMNAFDIAIKFDCSVADVRRVVSVQGALQCN